MMFGRENKTEADDGKYFPKQEGKGSTSLYPASGLGAPITSILKGRENTLARLGLGWKVYGVGVREYGSWVRV